MFQGKEVFTIAVLSHKALPKTSKGLTASKVIIIRSFFVSELHCAQNNNCLFSLWFGSSLIYRMHRSRSRWRCFCLARRSIRGRKSSKARLCAFCIRSRSIRRTTRAHTRWRRKISCRSWACRRRLAHAKARAKTVNHARCRSIATSRATATIMHQSRYETSNNNKNNNKNHRRLLLTPHNNHLHHNQHYHQW